MLWFLDLKASRMTDPATANTLALQCLWGKLQMCCTSKQEGFQQKNPTQPTAPNPKLIKPQRQKEPQNKTKKPQPNQTNQTKHNTAIKKRKTKLKRRKIGEKKREQTKKASKKASPRANKLQASAGTALVVLSLHNAFQPSWAPPICPSLFSACVSHF